MDIKGWWALVAGTFVAALVATLVLRAQQPTADLRLLWLVVAALGIGLVIVTGLWAWPPFRNWYTYRFDAPSPILADGEQHDIPIVVKVRWPHVLHGWMIRLLVDKTGGEAGQGNTQPIERYWFDRDTHAYGLPAPVPRGERMRATLHVIGNQPWQGFVLVEGSTTGGLRTYMQPFEIVSSQ